MLSPRAAALGLAVVALVLATGNVYETVRRSTIPLALDGRVEAEEVRREKHPGVDDVHLLTLDGRRVHVDEHVARLVSEGDGLQKEAWSSTLTVARTRHELKLSSDATGMFAMMPLLLLVITASLWWRPGSGRPRPHEKT